MLNVVLCADKKVLLGLAATVRSALESSSEPMNVWVIENGISRRNQQFLHESWDHPMLGDVTFRPLDSQKVRGFRSTRYLKSKFAYARYFIPEMFPELSRCIYLDTDLLVFKDLAGSDEIDLDEKPLAAVADISSRLNRSADTTRRLGLKAETVYFNSGLLVTDMEYWRAEEISRRLIETSHDNFDILHSQDQDALNIVFEGKTNLLDPSWNTSQYEKPEEIQGKIIHFIGTIKPWHARYAENFEEPYYRTVMFEAFRDILSRTKFDRDFSRRWGAAYRAMERFESTLPTLDMLLGKSRRIFR